ncbi:hypothetical protein BDV93DRAFT_506182 [Ceratobasidium sp. AG-I]|nr:hypothetical protein BDV93DRAFT_506182 [Ceratobasidium sp. AG-I]
MSSTGEYRVVAPNQPSVVRPHKRSRANSSPLADNVRVYQNRSATPFAPPSTRDPSPAPTKQTQADLTSSVQCLLRIKKSDSSAYKNFDDLTVVYKKTGRLTHNRFKCKHLHSIKCGPTTKQAQSLGTFGITGGTPLTLTPEYLQKLLHLDTCKHQPHRNTISKDIRRIYQATQRKITEMLEIQEGIFHLALALFQSSNGLDFLGIVLFCHLFMLDKPTTMERFVFECISYTNAHSGAGLAKVLHLPLKCTLTNPTLRSGALSATMRPQ